MGRERGGGGPRRLIAGLRVTPRDETLLDVVRPLFPEVDSEGELAHRLWRRGLELTLAEVAGLGVTMPPGTTDEQLATLVAQRLLLCLPLLQRTGKVALLGIESAPPVLAMPTSPPDGLADIDTAAARTIAGMGGGDFL